MRSLKKFVRYPARQSSVAQPDLNGNLPSGKSLIRFAVLMAIAGVFISLSPSTPAFGQTTATADAQSDVDPDAIDALNKMSAYMQTLKVFQVQDVVTNDDVLDNGQIVQYDSTVDLLAARPNRLRVEVTSDYKHRLFLYDGKNFTVWGMLTNYYATVPAPPTIGELLDVVDEKYGIELPLIDLFRWGDTAEDIAKIKSADDMGPSTVNGITCEHYTFHQENVDWQIWIQLGQFPLPLKLVIRTLTDDARPQHSDILTWNLAPSYNNDAFTFIPPPEAKRIVLAEQKSDATDTGK